MLTDAILFLVCRGSISRIELSLIGSVHLAYFLNITSDVIMNIIGTVE